MMVTTSSYLITTPALMLQVSHADRHIRYSGQHQPTCPSWLCPKSMWGWGWGGSKCWIAALVLTTLQIRICCP